MVLNISGFETETVGTIPADWYLGFDDDGIIEVVNTSPVVGEKSFRVGEFADGTSYVNRPVGDEDIRMSFVFGEAESAGENEEWAIEVRSGGSAIYSWLIYRRNTSTDPFDIAFDTAAQMADGSYAGGNVGTNVGTVTADTFHKLELRDPSSSLKLYIDDELVYDTGQAFSGADELRIVAEDAIIRLDSPDVGIPSTFVFEKGDNVILAGSADNQYAIEGVEKEPVSDGGKSDLAFVDGQGIDFDTS